MLVRFPDPRRLFRLTARWLLVLALVIQPALVQAAELHESTHGSAAVGHDDTAGVDHHDSFAPHEQRGSDALHVALHIVHCCGHMPAMGTVTLAMPNFYLAGAQRFDLRVDAYDTGPPASPLRPPIAA